MTQIKDVSGTAFVVAEFRAEENRAAAPLYHDPVVELFLNDETRDAARSIADRFPPVKDMVRVRTRYFDDTLDKHIQARFRQVVILGAGLDTRAVRKQAAGVRYFEIDDPQTIAVKKACYERHGIDVDFPMIPGNYVMDGLIRLLKHHDFDFNLPTYFIWEGNVMYLAIDTVREILRELRLCVSTFRLSCDYLAEAVITKSTGDPGVVSLVESFEDMGAPWLSGITDIHAFARALKLRVNEDLTTGELYRRYWPGRPTTSSIFDYYSVCTLAS